MTATLLDESVEVGLPRGWREWRLGDLASIVAGQSPPGHTYRKSPEGLPFFQGKADFGSRHPVARVWCVSPQRIALPGDILISVRAPVGPTNVADRECCFGRGLAAIRVHDEADRDFILAYLRCIEPALSRLGSGSTFGAVNRELLTALRVPAPPLSEQRRLSALIESSTNCTATARKAASEQLDSIKSLLPRVLGSAFEGSSVAAWPLKPLGTILVQRREVLHPHEKRTGSATFVGLEHLERGTGGRIGSVTIDLARLTGRKPRFVKGDIVYGYLRPYLNKVWIAEFDGLCSVDQFAYQVRGTTYDAEYVAWFMRSPTFLRRSSIETTTGQLPRIGVEEIAAVEIPYPSESIRREVVQRLRAQVAAIDRARSAASDARAATAALPEALLRSVFGGRV